MVDKPDGSIGITFDKIDPTTIGANPNPLPAILKQRKNVVVANAVLIAVSA